MAAARGADARFHERAGAFDMLEPLVCGDQHRIDLANDVLGASDHVLDMGDPIKIVDLAREMITLSGFRPDEDIEIELTGMRPGEKLFEELSIEGEDIARTSHPKVGVWKKRQEDWESLLAAMNSLISDADGLDRNGVRTRLREIVPEFLLESPSVPQQSSSSAAASVG